MANKTIASLKDLEQKGNQYNRIDIVEENVETDIQRGKGTNRKMKQRSLEVDINNLQGEGEFPCPKCGTMISPDDESEETYTVIDTKGDDEEIEEVIIQCKRCNSIIQLKGFEKLEEAESESSFKLSEPGNGSQPGLHTVHSLSFEGKTIGRVNIEYLQQEDVKAFSKINRSLKAGDAFQARIFIDSSSGVTVTSLGSKGLAEIAKVLKRHGKGIRDREIFVVSIENGKEKLVGRAENLIQASTS